MARQPKENLYSSFRHAFEGLYYVIKEERNARIHLLATILVVALGLWLHLSTIEWALIITAIALVFAGELLNTVTELTIDLITLERLPLAKHAKDVAAGAVLVASLAAALLGFLILGPRLWAKLCTLWG
ncbi:MAG: diacylglycerol kinase family protein [Anaerolineae bacterium]|nr:diacylglycerol kinase family protein [Anaerolineae bacterium]